MLFAVFPLRRLEGAHHDHGKPPLERGRVGLVGIGLVGRRWSARPYQLDRRLGFGGGFDAEVFRQDLPQRLVNADRRRCFTFGRVDTHVRSRGRVMRGVDGEERNGGVLARQAASRYAAEAGLELFDQPVSPAMTRHPEPWFEDLVGPFEASHDLVRRNPAFEEFGPDNSLAQLLADCQEVHLQGRQDHADIARTRTEGFRTRLLESVLDLPHDGPIFQLGMLEVLAAPQKTEDAVFRFLAVLAEHEGSDQRLCLHRFQGEFVSFRVGQRQPFDQRHWNLA
jgi:hypothetical protein